MVDINEPNADIYLDSTNHTLSWQASPNMTLAGSSIAAGSNANLDFSHPSSMTSGATTAVNPHAELGLPSSMVMTSYRQPELMLPSMVSPNELHYSQDPSSTASLSQFMDPSGLLLVPESTPNLNSVGPISHSSSFQPEPSSAHLNMEWMNGSKARKRKQSSPYLAKYLEEGRYNSQQQAATAYGYPMQATGYPHGSFQGGVANGVDWQQQQHAAAAAAAAQASYVNASSAYAAGSQSAAAAAAAAIMNHVNGAIGSGSGGQLLGLGGSGSVYANSPMSSSSPFGTLPATVMYPGMGMGMVGHGHRGSIGMGGGGGNGGNGVATAPSASSTTIKVPMAPMHRSNSLSGGTGDARKSAPLLLPFHHKNDNRIIPQSFTNHSNVLAPYSVEEIQGVKQAYLAKLADLDFDNVTVVELKTFLREFNLASGGRKAILVERIHQIAEYLRNERNGTANPGGSDSSLPSFTAASQDGTDSFFYTASPTAFLSSPSQQGTQTSAAVSANNANHQALSSPAPNISHAY